MLRCTHPSYRRRNVFEAAIHTEPGASGTHEPPSGGPHIGGAPATPIAALSGSTHKAPGSAGGYLLLFTSAISKVKDCTGYREIAKRDRLIPHGRQTALQSSVPGARRSV